MNRKIKTLTFVLCIVLTLLYVCVSHFDSSSSGNTTEQGTCIDGFYFSDNVRSNSFKIVPDKQKIHTFRHNPLDDIDYSGGYALYDIVHELEELPQSNTRNLSIDNAVNSGAKAKLTIFAVDLNDRPLSKVSVHAIYQSRNPLSYDADEYITETDENGLASIEVKCCMEMNISLSKEGYYESKYKYCFLKKGYLCVKNGRWLPWNPILEMKLKRIRDPQRRKIKKVRLEFPSRDVAYGFDSSEGDFVEPYGKGVKTDFNISFFSNATMEGKKQYCYTNEVIFTSTDENTGFLVLPLDMYSQYPIAYEAPVDGYDSSLFFARRLWGPSAQCVQTINPLKEGNYIVFRANAFDDDDHAGNTMIYGKIIPREFTMGYDPKTDKAVLRFMYYYNPIPDDRNMEGEDDIWWSMREESNE